MYEPRPIDTSDIKLPEELVELIEQVAENVHDIWAEGRMKEGWTYGKERDLKNMLDNRLVPYNQLSETEKNYDRSTAIGTIKLIIKKGFRIEKTDVDVCEGGKCDGE